MKFLAAQPFEKHFYEACPGHLSSLYGILIKNSFERRFLMNRLAEKMEGEKKWIDTSHKSIDGLFETINSRDLFSSKEIILCDDIGRFKKEGFTWVKRLKYLPEELFLILGGEEFPHYNEVKKEIILLDLSLEKPWDRIARLNRWLLEEAQKRGKKFTQEAINALAKLPDYDFALLLQEMKKWMIYLGEEKVISENIIQTVGSLDFSQKGWHLSEQIIWEGKGDFMALDHLNASQIQTLFFQLRYHLQLGLVICSSLERDEEKLLKKKYPKISPRAWLRYKKLASTLKMPYFRRGLKELFQVELDSRQKSVPSKVHLERFFMALQQGNSYA